MNNVVTIILTILAYLVVAAILGFSVYFGYRGFRKDWQEADANQLKDKKIKLLVTCALVLVLAFVAINTGKTFSDFYHYDAYFDARDNHVQYLKQYNPNLDGTIAGDTEVYIIAGDNVVFNEDGTIVEPEKHPSLLILGGTHPNEPAGQLAATVILENAKVGPDTILYVITEANKSGYSHSHPQEASPFYYNITTASGAKRTFKFGSRAANSVDQWPNPDVYTTLKGTKLSTNDARNLNRSYPGNPTGTYTEQIAYAIAELIRQNDIKMEIDLHEASPEYLTINAIVYHERAASIAANAKMWYIDGLDHDFQIESNVSPKALRGLTHRELGDATNTIALLCETSNSAQGKIRGKFIEDLITDGMIDKFYEKAVELTTPEKKIIYGKPAKMEVRVGRHVQSVLAFILAYNDEVNDAGGFGLETAERSKFLRDCGELNVDIDLLTHLPKDSAEDMARYNEVQTNLLSDDMYHSLVKYGVGSFLADPKN